MDDQGGRECQPPRPRKSDAPADTCDLPARVSARARASPPRRGAKEKKEYERQSLRYYFQGLSRRARALRVAHAALYYGYDKFRM